MTDPYKTLALMAPQVADRDLDQVWDRIGPQVSGCRVGWWDARRPGRWLVGVAAAGGVATALVMWPTSTPSAFASWTPTPAVATAAQAAAAQEQCEVVLHGSVEQTQRYPTSAVNPWLPTSDAELAGRRVLVAEQRGTFTYVLSSNGAWTVGCLYSAAMGDGSTTASTTRLSLHPPPGGPGCGGGRCRDSGGPHGHRVGGERLPVGVVAGGREGRRLVEPGPGDRAHEGRQHRRGGHARLVGAQAVVRGHRSDTGARLDRRLSGVGRPAPPRGLGPLVGGYARPVMSPLRVKTRRAERF